MQTLGNTQYNLPGQKNFYRGKVREVYTLENDLLVMVATDRISAFDVILPEGIPYKGQVLNQVALSFLEKTKSVVPNWLVASPHPNVMIGKACEPFKVEMVIRGYLTGHAWREYKSGKRVLCGVPMPDGMVENQKFPEPIITPTTKADQGHDEDISREDILAQGIVGEADYIQLEKYTRDLFALGTKMAAEKGLILVDTKYEFGKNKGEILLIDEIHTPDSSRYFYSEGYEEKLKNGEPQKQLSKEFVRQWLIENGFQGKDGQQIPQMDTNFVDSVTNRYVELYEKITGDSFEKQNSNNLQAEVEQSILTYLEK